MSSKNLPTPPIRANYSLFSGYSPFAKRMNRIMGFVLQSQVCFRPCHIALLQIMLAIVKKFKNDMSSNFSWIFLFKCSIETIEKIIISTWNFKDQKLDVFWEGQTLHKTWACLAGNVEYIRAPVFGIGWCSKSSLADLLPAAQRMSLRQRLCLRALLEQGVTKQDLGKNLKIHLLPYLEKHWQAGQQLYYITTVYHRSAIQVESTSRSSAPDHVW